MADVTMTLEEYEALRRLITSERESEGAELAAAEPEKKKRKVSRYQKEFGKQSKLLKLKHPRTAQKDLMDRAHTATRKALGMPRRSKR